MMIRLTWDKLREYGGVALFLMVAALFTVWLLFGAATMRSQSLEIEREVQRQLIVHQQSAAERTCANAQMVRFIIIVGNKRAHELKTGSYLTPPQLKRIREYTQVACQYVALPPIH